MYFKTIRKMHLFFKEKGISSEKSVLAKKTEVSKQRNSISFAEGAIEMRKKFLGLKICSLALAEVKALVLANATLSKADLSALIEANSLIVPVWDKVDNALALVVGDGPIAAARRDFFFTLLEGKQSKKIFEEIMRALK